MNPMEAFNLGFWATVGYTVAGIVMIIGIVAIVFLAFMANELYRDWKRKRKRP